MLKILGIVAAILLCSTTTSAGERGASANTGPPSAMQNAQEVAIGVQVAEDLQTACVNPEDDAVTTAGDIEQWQWLDRIAIFMESGEKNLLSSEGSDFVLMIIRSNSLASFAVTSDSGMASTEVDSLSDTKITSVGSELALLKGPHCVAFIHTGQNPVFC